jgi:hypothetical protein
LPQPAAQNRGPAPASTSIRPSGSGLARIRLGGSDPLWFNWHIAIPSTAFPHFSFITAAAKADAFILATTQAAAVEILKNLDYRLQ